MPTNAPTPSNAPNGDEYGVPTAYGAATGPRETARVTGGRAFGASVRIAERAAYLRCLGCYGTEATPSILPSDDEG